MLKYLISNNEEDGDLTKKMERGAGQTAAMTDEKNCAPAGPASRFLDRSSLNDDVYDVTSKSTGLKDGFDSRPV